VRPVLRNDRQVARVSSMVVQIFKEGWLTVNRGGRFDHVRLRRLPHLNLYLVERAQQKPAVFAEFDLRLIGSNLRRGLPH